MKIFTFIIIVLLISYQAKVFSQPCLPEGITFETQAQIENFQTNYPNCTEIEGDVEINGNDITNLNGLNVLTSIWGNFSIGVWNGGNPILTSLTGLDNLSSIGGHFQIEGNPALTSLTGLANLTSIGGYLAIMHNDALTSLTGLYSVASIGESLGIRYNETLTSLTGLSNVVSIGGDSNIYGNDALTSLTGLNNVTSIMGDLGIWGNPSLTSLTGLDNVTSIGGDFYIGNNDALTSLTGLDNLSSIGGYLRIGAYWTDDGNIALTSLTGLSNVVSIGGALIIEANTALASLAGLDNIDAASISNLRIWANTSLSTCEVQSICNYLASPNGTIQIWVNAQGCNSQQEVEEACLVSVSEIKLEEKFTISPNPLESTTLIQYTLHYNSPVTLKILDLSGREIATLVNEVQMQGEQILEFNSAGLKPGIYFCVLKTNPGQAGQTKKIVKL